MPNLTSLGQASSSGFSASVVHCDGIDRRPAEEHVEGDRAWFVLRGRFDLRSGRGRRVGDPGTAVLLRAGESFEVHHPEPCGDVCLAVGGPLVSSALEDRAETAAPLSVESYLQLRALASRIARNDRPDPMALEEAVIRALDVSEPPREPSPRERQLAAAVARTLAIRFDEPLSLATLARPHGISVFALSRAFRKVCGTSVHRALVRVRVRHAIALMLDTNWSLARVAAECGFASHAHLTTVFRRELGRLPGELRRLSSHATFQPAKVSR